MTFNHMTPQSSLNLVSGPVAYSGITMKPKCFWMKVCFVLLTSEAVWGIRCVSVWFTCSFGLAFSAIQYYLMLFRVVSQRFLMVDFSQTTEPSGSVESLRCVEVEKQKRGCTALEYAQGASPSGPRMLCQEELFQRWLSSPGASLCRKVASSLQATWSKPRCSKQKQHFKGDNSDYQAANKAFYLCLIQLVVLSIVWFLGAGQAV